MLTCQNGACKKIFKAPLRTLNIQVSPTETYDACPYCLTKIKVPEKNIEYETFENLKVGQKPLKIEDSVKCHFHPGYLSERTSKENIPEECLVCKDILDCMLRKMRM
jgi:hypothetical protein